MPARSDSDDCMFVVYLLIGLAARGVKEFSTARQSFHAIFEKLCAQNEADVIKVYGRVPMSHLLFGTYEDVDAGFDWLYRVGSLSAFGTDTYILTLSLEAAQQLEQQYISDQEHGAALTCLCQELHTLMNNAGMIMKTRA